MFRDTVTLEDAVTVVSVMESSMQVQFLAEIAVIRDLSCWCVANSLHLFGKDFMQSWKVGNQRLQQVIFSPS